MSSDVETRVPATPQESAVGFDLMRVLLFHAFARRKTPMVVTPKMMENPPEGMLRVVLRRDGAVMAWIEPPTEQEMRPGVPYVPDPKARL